jgi:hypothetical protein
LISSSVLSVILTAERPLHFQQRRKRVERVREWQTDDQHHETIVTADRGNFLADDVGKNPLGFKLGQRGKDARLGSGGERFGR